MNSYASKPVNPVMIDLNIGDQLTSVSCGNIVVELIKFIAYQRQQIPYTYPWLKQVITKRKSIDEHELKESLVSERHYRVASTALQNLDFILKSLLLEINGLVIPDEVCITFGGTPVTCKEMYRLLLPTMCHKPQCHSTLIASDQKIQMNVFRSLVEKLSQYSLNPIPPTNMYVYIKKKTTESQEAFITSDNFEPTSGCRIPKTSKIIVIDFRTQKYDGVACCNTFQIFGEASVEKKELKNDYEDYNEIESTDMFVWYQSNYIMKGFKDCVVNGSSVTNAWLNS